MIPTGKRVDLPPDGTTPPTLASVGTRLQSHRAQLIDNWLREIVPIGSPAYSHDELRLRLTDLVDRLIAILLAGNEPSLVAARQVGRELADLLYMTTEGLERSHAVLSEVVIQAVPGEWRELRRAAGRMITAIVGGYHDRSRFAVLDEQESTIDALVTQLERTQAALDESQARLHSIFHDSPLGIWMGDLTGRTLEASPALLKLLGLSSDELRTADVTLLVHPDDRDRFVPLWGQLASGHLESFQTETRVMHKLGHTLWGNLMVTMVRDAAGTPRYIVAVLQDAGNQRRAADTLRRADERVRLLVENSGDLIAIVNALGEGDFFSPASYSILGYRPDELRRKRIWPLLVSGPLGEVNDYWEQLRAQPGVPLPMELRLRHKDGSERWIGMVCTNQLDDPGIQGVVMNARDITARKADQEKMTHLANTDHVTGLVSRRYFMAQLEQALTRGQRVAVLFADLDRFKVINDSLGHAIGDEALRAMGRRFRSCAGEGDVVARIGGDEFALLLVDADEERAWATANRMLSALRDPVPLEHYQTILSTSIGIALSGPTLGAPDDLIRAADLALYRAKADGRAVAAVFEPEMHEAAMTRMELEADLRHALDRGELFLVYQPEVDLRTGTTVALEALVRWQHPTRGLVPPDEFVEIAEETGQILPVGQWVMAEACQQVRRWREAGVPIDDTTLAINLTSRELRQDGLIGQISTCLRAADLAPERLCLEVSERILTEDVIAATPVLHTLRDLGVQIAIDDFGVGYTSITSWPELTASTLKIDRSLTARLAPPQNALAFIQAFTTLAHTLQMSVCAEGIETSAQLAHVRAAGCDHGQGYLFAPALRVDDVPAFLARRHCTTG